MKKIFITGDRSMEAFAAVGIVNAVIEDLRRANAGTVIGIGTGNCAVGIERAVRYMTPVGSENVVSYTLDGEGNVDFEEAFRDLAEHVDEVVFIHTDPLSSRIGRALAATFPPEKILMPLQEAMASL